MIHWNFEKWNLNDLRDNPKNPRRLSIQAAKELQKSFDRFGQCDPIQINRDGEIIGGHQRVKLLKGQNEKEVYAMVPDRLLASEEINELCLRLNKNVGSFDDDILANEWDIDLLLDCGFTLEELHLDTEEDTQDEKITFTISCNNQSESQKIEEALTDLISNYNNTKMKVKKHGRKS